jgi:hypothetical protein
VEVSFAELSFLKVLGTTLRAIGRGLGRGTLARASTASADKPIVSARVVAKAVDRNAAARMNGVTMFLRGESLNRSSPTSI